MAEESLRFLDQDGTVGPRISNELEKLNIQWVDSENFDLRWSKFSRMPPDDLLKMTSSEPYILEWADMTYLRQAASQNSTNWILTSGKLNDPKWPDDENLTSGELSILE